MIIHINGWPGVGKKTIGEALSRLLNARFTHTGLRDHSRLKTRPPIQFHDDFACCSTETASVRKNVDPWPTRDSTQIFPPCISMMRFEMASPNPVPPFSRVAKLSACWNSWKSLA